MRHIPILEVVTSVTQPPGHYEGTRRYVATGDVDGTEVVGGENVSYESKPSRANLVGGKDDIIFAKMMSTYKVVHLNEELADNIYSTGFFNLRAKKNLVRPRYLYWFIRSPNFQIEKDRYCTGATQKALTLSGLEEIAIPLPETVQEQDRIALILDKADSIRRKRRQSLDLADKLLRSAFLEMFGDPITNPKKLPLSPIKEMGRVVTGNTPPRKDPENYGPGIEWIKSDNVGTPYHFLTRAEETLTKRGQSIGRTVPPGATLVTCIAGSPSSIGNAALADRDVAFNQQINAVVPNRKVDPFFLYCQFLVGKKLVQSASTNSMKGMVSKGKFQEIEFIHASHDEQKKFGLIFKKILRTTGKLQSGCADGDALFGSLSQRAFSGEL